MQRICRNIKTKEIIPDFQGLPSEGTLIGNAVKAGYGKAEDFEEIMVDDVTYKTELNKFLDSNKASRESEELRIKNKRIQLKQKVKTALALDDEEANFLLGD